MDIKIFLIFMVILNVMQQSPAAYRDLTCVEPEPGYTKRMLYYFTAREVEKACPTQVDLILRIGNEVFCTFLCGIVSLMLAYTYVYAPLIGNCAKKRWTVMVFMFQAWRTRRSLCRFCGTSPCQAKRTSWKRFRPRIKNVTEFEERSNAMRLFSLGLELSVDLTKELPRDELYWARKYCDQFEEDHMVLFPLCIQRQINDWYPVPH
ncbi:uncharacterized protein LOC117322831 [Pecten maximus]|uniref:uncharacterized protein LOC117322831 n=1 Tax=Pecten maximus TaxID=6579 RepID=UPI0014584D60|nr:uncharacterized protein LOC117322831 [Pecten maximus]